MIYSLKDVNKNGLIREIYVPEADAIAKTANNQPEDGMHTIVIGGLYKGELSYYRLDFAQDNSKSEREYLPLLRNHRYVFNIKEVNRIGFNDPETALKSTSTNVLDYDLVSWDETIHEMHINGQHYFGLENKDINYSSKFDKNDLSKNTTSIKYQTNYPFSTKLPMNLKWENPGVASEYFDAKWDMNTKQINITRLKTNESNKVISEILNISFGTFKVPVLITQDYFDFVYMIDCSTVKVNGTYIAGSELDPNEHYIELNLVVPQKSKDDLLDAKYILSTPVEKGISFHATDSFKESDFIDLVKGTYSVKVKLAGSGTLESLAGTDPFPIAINSNSSSQSNCEATITPVRGDITIVSVSNYDWEYLADANRPITKVIQTSTNFGPNDDSRVKIGNINLVSTANSIRDIESWLTGDKVVNGKKVIADVLFITSERQAKAGSFIEENLNPSIITDYMEKGGVVIYLTGNNKPAQVNPLLNAILGTSGVGVKDAAIAWERIPFLGNPLRKNSYQQKQGIANDEIDYKWQSYVNTLKLDPVLNGPFGDLTEVQWAEDWDKEVAVSGLPENLLGLTIYSYEEYLTGTKLDEDTGLKIVSNDATFFRYQTDNRNFIFGGDPGILTQNDISKGTNLTHTTSYTFNYDPVTFEPIPRPSYGSKSKGESYNSAWVCNMIAWAIDRAYSPELISLKNQLKK